jgi:hypothetical protein
MTMGRARSPSEPELNIRGLTARSYKAAFLITILRERLQTSYFRAASPKIV